MTTPTAGPATRPAARRRLRHGARVAGLLAGALVGLALLAAALVPRLAGWQVFAVTSGSMEPGIGVGAAVAVEPVDVTGIRVGDVVTFHEDGTGGVTTHRVVDVDDRGDGVSFTTQGDANDVPDGRVVPGGAVVGRVVGDVPLAGYALDLLATPLGAGLAATAVAVAVLTPRRPAARRHDRQDADGRDDEEAEGSGAPTASA